MDTERLEITEKNIAHAGEIIRRGGLVAFPTETVYGLGPMRWMRMRFGRCTKPKAVPAIIP